jgi:hypothetical protein
VLDSAGEGLRVQFRTSARTCDLHVDGLLRGITTLVVALSATLRAAQVQRLAFGTESSLSFAVGARTDRR